MKQLCLLLLSLYTVVCCQRGTIPQPDRLIVGQCYYYQGPLSRLYALFKPVLNPYWFRYLGRKGCTVIMRAYTTGETRRLLDRYEQVVQ